MEKVMKIKFIGLSLLSIFIMGASDCQGEDPKERYLRLSVDVKPVAAQVVKLPDGRTIDFPFVANALFYYTVMKDPHFIIDRPILTNYPSAPGAGGSFKLTEATDDDMLDRWGFARHQYDDEDPDKKSFSKTAMPENPACIHYAPALNLFANVVAFELVGSGGIHGGYPGVPVGGSLKFDKSQLSVTLQSEDPLSGKPIAIDAGRASEWKMSASIDYLSMIGLDFFFKTPIFKVVNSAFQDSVNHLVDVHMKRMNVKNWVNAWESKIIFDPVISNGDTHLAMRGGWRANVRVGDTFAVYNMHYKWVDDKVCEGLDYAIPNPAEPVAEIRIVEAGQDVSIGLVTSASKDYRVDAGAITKVKALVK